MQAPFSFHIPTQVRFGDGVSAEVTEVLHHDAQVIAVLRGGKSAVSDPVVARLKEQSRAVHVRVCRGEPSVVSVNDAVDALAPLNIDAVVACGGGSVIDTGKAVAFCLGHGMRLSDDFAKVPPSSLSAQPPLPLLAIPTTAGTGAEVTSNAVLDVPSKRAKVSLRGRGLYAAHALIDPLLMRSAPRQTVLFSGLDAVVQTIEAYTSKAATPFSDALTQPNVARALRALRTVLHSSDPAAWRELAWVSVTSGVALANSGLGAAHGLASVLGGRYDAAHGALCGALLTPVLRQNMRASSPGSGIRDRLEHCIAVIDEVFPPPPGADALCGLEDWQAAHGLPRLAEFGVEANDIASLAHLSRAASSSQKNGVALKEADFEMILRMAL